MAKLKIGLKMKDASKRISAAILAVILLMLGLTAAGVFDVASYVVVIAKLGAVLVLFIEIGLMGIIKRKGKDLDFITGTELVIGALVALEVILHLVGVTVPALSALGGWILLVFGLVFFVEAWVR